MKVFAGPVLLALTAQTSAFTLSSRGTSSSALMANVLDGKEIAQDFTPINNMLFVKKAEIIDQTDGGLFLTGKVRN